MSEDKPLSIEQAGNKIKADEKTMPARVHDEAQKQDISCAMPADRRKYLLYCASLVQFVDGDLMRKLAVKMPENIRTMYSGKDMAQMVRAYLAMSIHGVSKQMISKKTGIPMKVISDFDFMAQIAVKRAIAKAKESGIAIIGGLNG